MNNFGDKNRKQLEEQFRSRFENAQFSPPAHLWEQIDAALDEKPWYKRPLFYWTSGLVAALLLVVMFWFTMAYDNAGNSTEGTYVTDKNNIENKDFTKTPSNIPNVENKDIRNLPTPNETATNSTSEQKTQQTAASNAEGISDNPSINSNKNTINSNVDKDKKKTDLAIAVVWTDNTKNKKTDTILSDETEQTTALETLTSKKYPLDEFVFFKEFSLETEIPIEEDSTSKTATADNTTSQEDLKKASGIAINVGINHTQGIYQPSFRRDSLYTGLTIIDAYSSNLADTLPQTKISGNYQQTGFDVALQFGKNRRWSLNTGLAIGKANYSFGSTNYVLIDPTPQGINLKEFPNNQVEVNYEWLQIPIALGYQFGETRAKSFTGFAQLGTAIELLRSYSYVSADPRFTYALGNHRTINTQVWTQVGINYHITNRWTVWGGGTYKSSLSSLINEEGVTFSSQAYGWQVGTRFILFSSKKK